MPRSKKPPKCLCGECGQAVYSRGLGYSCYQAAARKVRAKKTTWDKLVALGLAAEKKRVNETRRAPITRRIEELAAAKAG